MRVGLIISRIISAATAAVCVWICAVCFIVGEGKPTAILCTAPFIITAAFLILHFMDKLKGFLERRSRKLLAAGLLIMFIAELAFAFSNKQYYSLERSSWDFGNVMASAESSASGGTIDSVYFARYPNNTALLLLDTLICRTVVFVTGGTTAFYPVMLVLNCLMLTAAVLFITMSCVRLRGVSCGALGFLACAVFLPFYLITPNVYSDTPAMICFAAGTYCTVQLFQENRLRSAVLIGVICGAGTAVKASAAVLVIAAAVVILFIEKDRLKRLTAVILSFAAVFLSISLLTSLLSPICAEESERYRFPYSHWVMMGLSTDGLYNDDDVCYTISAGDYSEKQAADNERIFERLNEFGFLGTVNHLLYTKTTSSWTSGTFGTLGTLSFPEAENALNSALTEGGALYVPVAAYSLGLYWSLMLLTAAGAVLARKRALNAESVMRLAIVGLYAFLMFWEGSSRYVFQISPLILALGAVSAHDVKEKLEAVIKHRKERQT